MKDKAKELLFDKIRNTPSKCVHGHKHRKQLQFVNVENMDDLDQISVNRLPNDAESSQVS